MNNQDDLREIHEILLEMISDISVLCEKHNIRFSLYCGTLLGAIREHSFIPWDDDADLTMPIDDYLRFFSIAQQELCDKYVVQSLCNTPAHPWMWMRVFRRNTCYLRHAWRELPVHHGIALDIYPMIGVAESQAGFMLQKAVLNAAKALRHIEYWEIIGFPMDPAQRRIAKAITFLPGRVRRTMSRFLFHLGAFPPEKKTRCCTLDGAEFVPKYSTDDWKAMTKAPIDGRWFPAPVEFDHLLRIMYGNYLQPPPEADRVGHGEPYGGVTVDTKKDYNWYLLGETE